MRSSSRGSNCVLARADWLEIRRRVGEGAFGVVYEAWDQRRRQRVAVKMPRSLDADTLYRFKREFRALADVRHRNLVALYDLVSDGDEWLFSMEFVDDGTPVALRSLASRRLTSRMLSRTVTRSPCSAAIVQVT